MKILWITNIVFPEAEKILTGKGELKSSGGWLLGTAEELLKNDEIELTVATPTSLVHELKYLKGGKISYYLFPFGKGNTKYNKDYELYWKEINRKLCPNVVHIHGTEFTHGLAYVKACGAKNVVVSIQGLVSIISKYYNSGLSLLDILKNITLRDLFKGTLFHDKNVFRRRGCYEVELLQLVNHVIGRTSWDRAHVWAINSNVHYHFCNEILRKEFYNSGSWRYEQCVPHTIFLSQATYPIKGLHIMLKSMPLILSHYPDVQIRVAGMDITRSKEGVLGWLKLSGYGKIIKILIKKYHLEDKICFLGNLDAKQMIKEYLRANVFVCPSSIENSPNSLGEAQILGTPCICSYAGGIPDMMKGNEHCIYRFEDEIMLAKEICDIFRYPLNMKINTDFAKKRHDRNTNILSLIQTYNCIVNENSSIA